MNYIREQKKKFFFNSFEIPCLWFWFVCLLCVAQSTDKQKIRVLIGNLLLPSKEKKNYGSKNRQKNLNQIISIEKGTQ